MRLIPRVRMPNPKPPCKKNGVDCPRREVGCQGKCEEYKAFHEARLELSRQSFEYAARIRQANGVLIEAAYKVQGKKKPER